jgi:hypothetical protein
VRYAADDGEGRFKGEAVSVTVLARLDTPEVAIDFVGERLTGLVPNATYSFNSGGSVAIDNEATYEMVAEWFGTTVSVVRLTSDSAGIADSAAQSLIIPARPDVVSSEPGGVFLAPVGVAESVYGRDDGQLTNVDDTMEYCFGDATTCGTTTNTVLGNTVLGNALGDAVLGGAVLGGAVLGSNMLGSAVLASTVGVWVPVTGTVVGDLAPGVYQVRYEAVPATVDTAGRFASQSVSVTVLAGQGELAITNITPDYTYVYGDKSFTIGLENTYGTGGVTFTIIDATPAGVATITPEGTVTVLGVGSFRIKAVKQGDTTHNGKEIVSELITITPAVIIELVSPTAGTTITIDTSDTAVSAVVAKLSVAYPSVEAYWDGGLITVPITAWIDTDGYNPDTAGSYIFTAVLDVPTNFVNPASLTLSVEIVVPETIPDGNPLGATTDTHRPPWLLIPILLLTGTGILHTKKTETRHS